MAKREDIRPAYYIERSAAIRAKARAAKAKAVIKAARGEVETWPEIDEVVVLDFMDFLFSIDEKVCRPPRQAAKLLAFIVQLYRAPGGPRPFPTRKQVALHLGMSVPTVDAVLNLHIAEGNLTIENRYRDGNIEQRRASAIKERIIVPSDVLIGVFDGWQG